MNRLATESSLYLRQHANNPVDWFPWGDEAIGRARELDRPIFLSIGYSACHWCHVMEHESFEDEATARLLNEHFISIKVDREERPDVDHIYMTALQLMTREGGGWPLSVWLTPDLHPFYAGTYYPPDDRFAPRRPSFKALLSAIAEAWRNRRSEIKDQSMSIAEHLRLLEYSKAGGAGDLVPAILDNAVRSLRQGFDPVNGGFGTAPKFPHALEIRLLLRLWQRTGQDDLLHLVRLSLDKMAAGGIADQIGGGFHRYSTDARWLVPHFEKMLYDNALLTPAYVDAWQATRDPEYRRIADETLDYVLREMTSAEGAFFSTQDADSEGEEGKFYVWSRHDIQEALGEEDESFLSFVYGVSDEGNFEGHNILSRPKTWEQLALLLQLPVAEIQARVKALGAKLYEVRSKRIWPGRDEKILTSWNGLMIAAFAQAGIAFGEERYVHAAARAAEFILTKMRSADGSLCRTCAVGGPARIAAYLEDFACLICALTDLFEATFETRWLEEALPLAKIMIAQFADPSGGGFFSTSDNHPHLIARTKESYDGSTPSGNSMAVTALLRLGRLTDQRELLDHAHRALKSFSEFLKESPAAAAQMLSALDMFLSPTSEFVVVGPSESEQTQRILKAIREQYRPNTIVLHHDPAKGEANTKLLPLLEGKIGGQEVQTYICENGTCRAPLVGSEAVEEWLVGNK